MKPDKPIIESLLDTDLYKLTMMQCVFHHFPETEIEYQLQIRKNLDLSSLLDVVKEECEALCDLTFSDDDINYLKSLGYFKDDFLAYLQNFQLNPLALSFSADKQLKLTIKGPWLECILFEVPVLAIISESYTQKHMDEVNTLYAHGRLTDKIALCHRHADEHFRFSDFGTRRRISHYWQQCLVERLSNEAAPFFAGTSNVFFARKYDVPAIGTMAHEFIQACQVLAPDLKHCQSYALKVWLKEYQGKLAIALTDTIGMKSFLEDFPEKLAKAYQGLRQDSGSPIEWGHQALAHYEKLNIDPRTKTLVFSDGLTILKALEIYWEFSGQAKMAFGIGTHLTHDAVLEPLDIVIKATECNGVPVVKISDSPGKVIAKDAARLKLIEQTFRLSES